MKMRCAAAVIAAGMLLTACGETDKSSSAVSEPLTITITDSSESSRAMSSVDSAPESSVTELPNETLHEITAYVNSYSGGRLTFTYNGRRLTVPFERERFVETPPQDKHSRLISEQIISNRLGEEVRAKLTVNEELTAVASCDVISLNGRVFGTGSENSDPTCPQEYFDYSMRRLDGSLVEFANPDRALEADLNDLPQMLKGCYPQYSPAVEISGYLFNDGSFILSDLRTEYTDTAGGRVFSDSYSGFERLTGYFGTVESVCRRRVEMLLNDGITRIEFPAFFADGDVCPGSQIMAAVCCDSDLYGSGGDVVFDCAVIYTDPADYGITGDLTRLTTARPADDGSGDFIAAS